MRVKQLMSLLAAGMLLAACETAGGGSGAEGGTGGQAGAGAATSTSTATRAVMVEDALGGMLERVGDRVFFGYDKSDLKPAARNTVQGWANFLKTNSGSFVVVAGHADERGTREYNLALGERRAASVKNYLVALGVASSRIRTVSFGKERPQDPGHNEASWAQNRRGVMTSQ